MKIWWCFSQVGTLVARVSSLQLFLVASQIRVSLICEYGELRTFIVQGGVMMKQQCMLKFKSLGGLQCEWKDGGKQSPRIHKKNHSFLQTLSTKF
jgi:hypothetical protein